MKYPLSFALLAGLGLSVAALSYAPAAPAAQVSVRIGAHFGPPSARVVAVPAYRRGHVWVPGQWRWRGHYRVWTRGHWVRVRHQRHWRGHHVPAHWVRGRHGGWYVRPGHWRR